MHLQTDKGLHLPTNKGEEDVIVDDSEGLVFFYGDTSSFSGFESETSTALHRKPKPKRVVTFEENGGDRQSRHDTINVRLRLMHTHPFIF